MINFVLNLRMINLQNNNPKAMSDSTAFIINSIPSVKGTIGGLVGNAVQSNFLNNYKKALVGSATNYKLIQQTIENSSPNETCREVLLKKYSAENLSDETYNAEMKIAAIMYRGFSARVDENTVRSGLKIPDMFDLVSYAKYHMLDKDENIENIQSSVKALQNIYAALWVNMDNYSKETDFQNYYLSVIPQWLFPYELEQNFSWQNEDDFYICKKSYTDDYNERIYSIVNAEWTSLADGKTKIFYKNPANEHRIYNTDRIDNVYAVAKNVPFAAFDGCIVFPAIHVKKGVRENVLVMYNCYRTLNSDRKAEGLDYIKNLRMDNIGSAGDVLIRSYNPDEEFEYFDNEKFREKYYKEITPNYLLKDKLISAFTPKNEADILYAIYHIERFSKEDKQRIFGAINGNWHSLVNNENHNFYIDPEDKNKKLPIGKFSIIGKSAPFLVFNFVGNPRKFFITPATYMHDGKREKVLVMYVNYSFIDFNGKSEGFGYAENLCVDNIQSADDVLIKVSR